jgi:hypothetical protein
VARRADGKKGEEGSGVVALSAGRWDVHLENLWVELGESLRRGILVAGEPAVGDERREIQWAAMQAPQTLRPKLVPAAVGTGSLAGHSEIVAAVALKESQSGEDTETQAGPTETCL